MNINKAVFLITIFLVVLFVSVISISLIYGDEQNYQIESPSERVAGAISIFEELKNPLYFRPKTLEIYSGGDVLISNTLELVGQESNGELGVPKSWYTLGWYKKSAKPGEEGNVIIDGHYNTNTGAPGAFWELKNVKLNDKVSIRDELNRGFTYTVSDIFYIGISDPNRTDIFKEKEGKSELTLITCGGVWNYQAGTYDKRLVVKAELTESPVRDIFDNSDSEDQEINEFSE